MDRLDRIVEIDDKIHNSFQSFMEKKGQFSETFAFPNTLAAFINFITSTKFIKGGIIELAYSDNTYSINILFRSQIEQFLKFQFIWMKFAEREMRVLEQIIGSFILIQKTLIMQRLGTKSIL